MRAGSSLACPGRFRDYRYATTARFPRASTCELLLAEQRENRVECEQRVFWLAVAAGPPGTARGGGGADLAWLKARKSSF